MLEVQHLTKKFKNGKGIFDVTFSIKRGKSLAFWNLMVLENLRLFATS